MTTEEPNDGSRIVGAEGAHPRGYEDFGGIVAPVVSRSEPSWPQPCRAPEGAPNVVVVLVDDMGFSDVGAFGSEIPTPAVDALADSGYRFTDFHVTPLCAPSRAALLTGANPHRAGFGFVPHLDPGFPGMSMSIPDRLPTLGESFRANGYATFMVGKWHLTHESKLHDGADKGSWPLQRGFDRYFGGMEGFTTLYHPHRLVRDNSPVAEDLPDDEYLTDRLTDEAIDMIDALRTGDSDRPFFLYFAHHAVHGPIQARPEDIERFRGAYRDGWDRARRDRFERQRALGLFGPDVELPASDESGFHDNRAWEELSADEQERFERYMEVYAAAVAAIDESLARLVAHLKEIGEYENTIIVFTSDNGGSAEGGADGTRSYFSQFLHEVDLPDGWVGDVPRRLDDIGGPRVHAHYPRGWAHVSNTPFREHKGSVYEGGVHSPLVLSWPDGLKRAESDDGVRREFSYITDLAPTLLDLAGLERPSEVHGEPALDADGRSLAPQLRGTGGGGREEGQHISLLGQRSFYRGRWKLVVPSRRPGNGPAAAQLFDRHVDPLERRDVADVHPELVAELEEQWRLAAWHNTVFPVPDGPGLFTTVPSTVLELSQPTTFRLGSPTVERYRSARLVGMRSFDIEIVGDGPLGEGVLVAHGDQGGGYAILVEEGRLCLSYNAYGDMSHVSALFPPGTVSLTARFETLPELRWRVTVLSGDDVLVRLDAVPMLVGMAPYTGISVGRDAGGPVDWSLHERRGAFAYAGPRFTARYVPGERIDGAAELVRAVDEVSARLMD